MQPSDRFRRQHDELVTFILEIEQALGARDFLTRVREVRRMMARLKGKLTVHSTMENDALYPRLLDHADPQVRVRSQRLFDELGTIYQAFAEHHAKWSSVEAMEAEPSAYVRSTQEIFTMLKIRMDRENSELYPLADREGSERVPSSESPS